MASCTHTVGDVFGAKAVAGPGILLNSGMQWFSPRAGGPNSIAPGKRPLANMAPVIVYEGTRPSFAAGAFGGRRIIRAITQIVADIVDYGFSSHSERLDPEAAKQLSEMGHGIKQVNEDHNLLGVEFANATAMSMEQDGTLVCGVDAIRPR